MNGTPGGSCTWAKERANHEHARQARTQGLLPADRGQRAIARGHRRGDRRRRRKLLSIFDFTLDHRGYGDPARIEKLRHFLLAGRAHRIRIALHEPELLERHEPRLIILLRQFPAAIAIHRTVGQARNATDPFIVADDHSVWHLLHHEQHRAVVALHSPPDAAAASRPLRGDLGADRARRRVVDARPLK